jgi:nucleoside-specific outer membrane channel protein Tsx
MKMALRTVLLGLATVVGAEHAVYAADLPAKSTPAISTAPVPFFLFQDNTVSYRIETSATDPGSSVHFVKNIANLTHVDAYQYGTNFFSIDFLQSTNADPTAPIIQNAVAPYNFSGQGSLELYALYRGSLSGNAVTHSKMFSFGFLKDISLSYGGDGESQNTEFAPNKRDIVGGIQFAFDVPGFLTVAVQAYHEWNHNGLAQAGNQLGIPPTYNSDFNPYTGTVNFKTTPEFEVTYLQPLSFFKLPLSISGFANIVMPKGKDGFGNNTRTEILTANRLTLDLGDVMFHRPKLLDVFVGYKYWLNKFGNNSHFGDNSYTPGSYENQVFAGVALHAF